uniref:Uncharacterized protein n=1 Tax=Lactuca sativa TaxID=4236 RepID=A0A9R1XDD6_LACSA|nr:hypothetical protein LSAT_V11C400214080 [Lactuca sativa]
MSPSEDEMKSCYYMSFQEYVYGGRKSIHPQYGTILGGKTNLRLVVALTVEWEAQLREGVETTTCTEATYVYEPITYREVNNEDLWNNISFEEPVVFQTNFHQPVVEDEGMNKNNTNENVFGDIEDDKKLEERNENMGCSRNKFDDDVFDVNDYYEDKEVSEEDDLIITGNVNYYDAYGFDGKEVTPDRPGARNPSKYLCPPYTKMHMTPKQKKSPKKKVDIKSTIVILYNCESYNHV